MRNLLFYHPETYKFISGVQRVQCETETTIESFIANRHKNIKNKITTKVF